MRGGASGPKLNPNRPLFLVSRWQATPPFRSDSPFPLCPLCSRPPATTFSSAPGCFCVPSPSCCPFLLSVSSRLLSSASPPSLHFPLPDCSTLSPKAQMTSAQQRATPPAPAAAAGASAATVCVSAPRPMKATTAQRTAGEGRNASPPSPSTDPSYLAVKSCGRFAPTLPPRMFPSLQNRSGLHPPSALLGLLCTCDPPVRPSHPPLACTVPIT